MTDLKQILTRLYGRDPTEEEYKRVNRISSAMGMADNDEFVLLIACLEAYNSLFKNIPTQTLIKTRKLRDETAKQVTALLDQWMPVQKAEFDRILEKTEEIVESMRSASSHAEKQATATIKKIAAEQQATLTRAVAASAEKVAAAASVKTLAKWISGGIIVCCLCLIGTGVIGYKIGKDSGMAQGIAQTTDQELLLKKRDAWANTESYKQAHAFYESGYLEKILDCNMAPGWYIKDNICFPAATTNENGKKINYGWELPK